MSYQIPITKKEGLIKQHRLDEISERLGSLADLVQPQPEAMEKLHAVNAETVAS